jgi:hypothetical protein
MSKLASHVAAQPSTLVPFPSVGSRDTLPHRIAPLAGEGLLGFMVRCDLANSFAIGSTTKMVGRYATGWQSLGAASWASGKVFDLLRLARLSGNDLTAIQALTFIPDVARVLDTNAFSIGVLGDIQGLAMCEQCWLSQRLIRRSFLLPGVHGCIWHACRLTGFCACLVDVRVGRHEWHGSGQSLTDTEVSLQRDLYRMWSIVLDDGSPAVLGRGYRTVGRLRARQPPEIRRAARRLQAQRGSLEALVAALVALEIEPAMLRGMLARDDDPPRCPNSTCPDFAPADGQSDPLRRLTTERHCRLCGTRFIGRRVLSTFDLDHGASSPSPTQVRRARRRLARWRRNLRLACAELAAEGRQITVGAALRRAGVPLNANLRAERLGLVAIVRAAARRQRLASRRDTTPFYRVTMPSYNRLVRAAMRRDWVCISDWASEEVGRPELALRRVHPWSVEEWGARDGVLEPLFDHRWAAELKSREAVIQVWVRAKRRESLALSNAWLERRLRPFDGDTRP